MLPKSIGLLVFIYCINKFTDRQYIQFINIQYKVGREREADIYREICVNRGKDTVDSIGIDR